MKVLVCDKETILLKLLTNELEPEGYEVFTADNGIDAINLVKEHQPEIIITNLLLPLINGFDFLSKVKEINERSSIIVYSAIKSEHIIEQIFLLGARDFIPKPFNPEKLVFKIKKMFPNG